MILDDAEDVSLNWTASADAGATSSIAKAAGYRSDTAVSLRYSFPNATPKYVYATRSFGSPVIAAGISMRVKSRPDVVVSCRVTPQSGAPTTYWFSRPIEAALDPDGWYLNAIQFAVPIAVSAITVIVGDAYDTPCAGELLVDDLQTLDAAGATWTLATHSPRVMPALSGSEVLGDRLGVAWHSAHGGGATFDRLKEAGCSFIRTDLWWEWVEVPVTGLGRYDFTWFDGVLAQLEARGMGVLFILGYGHTAYDVKTPAGITAMGKYAEAAAQHYAGRNVRFEVWNEPDHNWTGTAAEYAALLAGVIAGAKRGDPKVRISNGGLVWFDFARIKQYLQAGVGQGVTAWAMHAYRNDRPETLVDSALAFRWMQRRFNGASAPLWITEWGYSLGRLPATQAKTAPFEQQQAVAVVRQALTQWILNLPIAVLYDARDDGADPNNGEHNYGLLALDGSPKPAWTALRNLAIKTAETEFIGMFSDVPVGLHVAKFGGVASTLFVLWVSEKNLAVNVQLVSVGLLSYDGPPLTDSGSFLSVTIRDSDLPIYIRYRGLR